MIVLICRLEAIAGDAELNEKSQTELRQLAEQIQEMCESAMKEYEEKKEEEKDVISEGVHDSISIDSIGNVFEWIKKLLSVNAAADTNSLFCEVFFCRFYCLNPPGLYEPLIF